MLKMICDKTQLDRVKNELILTITSAKPLKELSKSKKLRLFEHIERMSKEKISEMAMKSTVKGKNKRRPKKQ